MILRTLLCCTLAGFAWAAPVRAADHAAHRQPAAPVKSVTKSAALAVGAALDARGHLWLARVDKGRLKVSRSEDSGMLSDPVAVTAESEIVVADGENWPKIAVADNGSVHLTWLQGLGKPMAGHIRYARSTDGGRSFAPPVIVNDDRQEISHRFDSLAIDGKGGVAIVWLDARERKDRGVKGSPETQVGLYAALSSDGGARFGPNRKIAGHSCQCCRTGLTWTADGPVAFWRHVYGRNIRDFSIANLKEGALRRVTDDDWLIEACPHHGGGIAADGQGDLHIVWFTQGSRRQGIFYRRVPQGDFLRGVAGTDFALGEPVRLGDPARQAGHPAVVAQGARVLVSWREFDGQHFSAWAMLSTDAGRSWGPAQRLADAAQAADYTVPLIDARRALVVWNTAAEGLRVLPLREGTQ
ncbi:MAG: exo-alpha-sialidase [Betaproteobacteria bacterium]|nr:exo-alpha-sialidase [Betaproteobacteria bacterium]